MKYRNMFLQFDVFICLKHNRKLKTYCNFDHVNKSESIYKECNKNYLKFQQIKMKIYTATTDLEFSMSFANLFIGLLIQSFLVYSSKGGLLHMTGHHFGHLKLLYRSFLLITSQNLSSFCRKASIHSLQTFIISLFLHSKAQWVSLPIPSQHKGQILSICLF